MEWRNEELAWQHSLDPKSPKVGDLAPDFELPLVIKKAGKAKTPKA